MKQACENGHRLTVVSLSFLITILLLLQPHSTHAIELHDQSAHDQKQMYDRRRIAKIAAGVMSVGVLCGTLFFVPSLWRNLRRSSSCGPTVADVATECDECMCGTNSSESGTMMGSPGSIGSSPMSSPIFVSLDPQQQLDSPVTLYLPIDSGSSASDDEPASLISADTLFLQEYVERCAVEGEEFIAYSEQLMSREFDARLAVEELQGKHRIVRCRFVSDEEFKREQLVGDEASSRRIFFFRLRAGIDLLKLLCSVREAQPSVKPSVTASLHQSPRRELHQMQLRCTDCRCSPARKIAVEVGVLPDELAFFEQELKVSVFRHLHDAIKRKYHSFVKRYHPDKTGCWAAPERQRREEVFKRVTAVYKRLDEYHRQNQ